MIQHAHVEFDLYEVEPEELDEIEKSLRFNAPGEIGNNGRKIIREAYIAAADAVANYEEFD